MYGFTKKKKKKNAGRRRVNMAGTELGDVCFRLGEFKFNHDDFDQQIRQFRFHASNPTEAVENDSVADAVDISWPCLGCSHEFADLEQLVQHKASCLSLKPKRSKPGYTCPADGCKFRSKDWDNFVGHHKKWHSIPGSKPHQAAVSDSSSDGESGAEAEDDFDDIYDPDPSFDVNDTDDDRDVEFDC